MRIIQEERTPEFLVRRVGNVTTDDRSFSSTMLHFHLTESELVAAIKFRPAIAQELDQKSKESAVMEIVWAKAKAGWDVQAVDKAIDDLLSHQCRITVASHF